ncbi:MAG: hypothetical protein K8Q97_04030 [Candidatus Andersenbacteria bacterium]|nr:hypothetical protein [Candidatus Andersenbacteria bacterium]
MTLLTPQTEFPPLESLYPQLPDRERPPTILLLVRSRDSYIEHQITNASTETVATKKCACLNCGGIGWVLCQRTSATTVTYRVYAYWGTDLTTTVDESSVLMYEMNAEIPADCDLKENATHISYIIITRDEVTILRNSDSLSIARKTT